MKQRRYIMLFGDTGSAVNELDDEAAGRLLKAILRYADAREEVALPGEEKLVYRMLLSQFARDEEAYRKRSEQNKRRYDTTKDTAPFSSIQQPSASFSMQYKEKDKDHDDDEDKDNDKDKDEEGVSARVSPESLPTAPSPSKTPAPADPTPCDPPTLDEVRAYCQQTGLQFDPARFCDYNAARGWMLGNRPMTDWKAAARVWASRGDQSAASGTSPPRGPRLVSEQAYTQREYTNSLDALDRMMANWNASSKHPPS